MEGKAEEEMENKGEEAEVEEIDREDSRKEAS